MLDDVSIGYSTTGGRRRRLPERELARQRAMTGMVFQSFNLFPHLTALGNVTLGLTKVRHGMTRADAKTRALAWLDRVDLSDRRLPLPRAIVRRTAAARGHRANARAGPQLVLLNEITSALDPELVGEVLATIKSLAGEGTTMLIVTHEMRFAREVSRRVVFMDNGRIAEQGPPNELLGQPRSARLREFLGNAHL